MKHHLIVLLACLATQIAMGEPSLAGKNVSKDAAIKKKWESWNLPFKPFRIIQFEFCNLDFYRGVTPVPRGPPKRAQSRPAARFAV